mmetsp:Transcript_83822/g.236919  ORF Transcript_83822/g.236919 Transcript_83822/m.236919 type:complete len:418 (+) Transcript_83822:159-1412(+)
MNGKLGYCKGFDDETGRVAVRMAAPGDDGKRKEFKIKPQNLKWDQYNGISYTAMGEFLVYSRKYDAATQRFIKDSERAQWLREGPSDEKVFTSLPIRFDETTRAYVTQPTVVAGDPQSHLISIGRYDGQVIHDDSDRVLYHGEGQAIVGLERKDYFAGNWWKGNPMGPGFELDSTGRCFYGEFQQVNEDPRNSWHGSSYSIGILLLPSGGWTMGRYVATRMPNPLVGVLVSYNMSDLPGDGIHGESNQRPPLQPEEDTSRFEGSITPDLHRRICRTFDKLAKRFPSFHALVASARPNLAAGFWSGDVNITSSLWAGDTTDLFSRPRDEALLESPKFAHLMSPLQQEDAQTSKSVAHYGLPGWLIGKLADDPHGVPTANKVRAMGTPCHPATLPRDDSPLNRSRSRETCLSSAPRPSA